MLGNDIPVCIVQVRTLSSRLPGKCFLPIHGVPMVLYLINRIRSDAYRLIVATSNEEFDDILSELLISSGVNVFRGPLADVHQRYKEILELLNLGPENILIRLTADNPIIDENFIKWALDEFIKSKAEYMCTEPSPNPSVGWVKGISAEFFYWKIFEKTFPMSLTDYDREHVTPMIRKIAKLQFSLSDLYEIRSRIKMCGVDTIYEYLHLKKLAEDHSMLAPFTIILNASVLKRSEK
jgi:spore coat polysaccharide biosynthesis protein SpsF (cytidylyltransferase family)